MTGCDLGPSWPSRVTVIDDVTKEAHPPWPSPVHPARDPLTAFGPNEWLVDELYEQYLKDKNSVDRAWWDFFEDYTPDGALGRRRRQRRSANGCGDAAAGSRQGRARLPPRPRRAREGTGRAAAKADTGAAQPPTAAPAQAAPAAPTGAAHRDGPHPRQAGPRSAPTAPREQPSPSPRPDPPSRARPSPPRTPRRRRSPRRSPRCAAPAARVVTNMEASLEVPTATSVRAVPAKLLIDNRIVINNHLARSRGGKVSFTHLIGFALVKALGAMPEMNNGFADDATASRCSSRPAHVNLGLAIDLSKPDGTRTAARAVASRPTETMDFAHFWTAYEDVVRKARGNKLTVEDFQGTTISADQPGHHRHRPLGAAADAGPGHDHRRRRAGVPRRVAGRERRRRSPATPSARSSR